MNIKIDVINGEVDLNELTRAVNRVLNKDRIKIKNDDSSLLVIDKDLAVGWNDEEEGCVDVIHTTNPLTPEDAVTLLMKIKKIKHKILDERKSKVDVLEFDL